MIFGAIESDNIAALKIIIDFTQKNPPGHMSPALFLPIQFFTLGRVSFSHSLSLIFRKC